MQWFSTFTLTDLSLCPLAVFIPAYIIDYKMEPALRFNSGSPGICKMVDAAGIYTLSYWL